MNFFTVIYTQAAFIECLQGSKNEGLRIPVTAISPFPQDVLLLYYAQWCGFCPSLNHVFIQLARLLPMDTFTVAR